MSNARFSILQARAVKDKRITDAQFRTLAALGMYTDNEGWCFPKQSTIGKDLGKSRQSVNRDIKALKELGYLQVESRFREDGSQTSNLYRLRFDLPSEGGETPVLQGVQPSLVTGGETSESDTINDPPNDPPNDSADAGKPYMGLDWKILNDEPITEDDLMDEDDLFRKEAEEFAWTISQNNADLQQLALTFMLSARTLPDLDRISFWRKTLRKMKNHKPFPVAPRHVQEATRRALRDKLTLDSPESVYKVAGRLSDEKWCPEADPEGVGNWAGRDEKWRQVV